MRRNTVRKPEPASGKEVDSVLLASRPVLHQTQPKPPTKPEKARSGGVTAINRRVNRRQLSPVEEELRSIYQQIEEKTSVVPLAAIAIADTGANSAEVDDTGKLDAALAHGNPISRYIRTRKESDYGDSDYAEVRGERILAPERMIRQVVGRDPKGNYIWDLVPDYLLRDTLTIRVRDSILTWAPAKYNLTRFRERFYDVNLYYSPLNEFSGDFTRESLAKELGIQEADIVRHVTNPVPGQYGTDNLREEGAVNLLKRRPELRSMPQRQCTWLDGEDIKELKKKRSKKTFASAKARREENRTSFAFPSVAMHRPVPQWWWFLLHPNGKSDFRGDEQPWPNGIVDLSASAENKKMNHRAMDWSNTAKYVTERWWDMLFSEVEPVRPLEEALPYEYESPAGIDSVDDDSETKVETVVTPVPASPAVDLDRAPLTAAKQTRAQKKALKKLAQEKAANDADESDPKISDPSPKKLTKSQRKLARAQRREERRKASAIVEPVAAVSEPVPAKTVEMGIPWTKAFEIARKNRETIDPILEAARVKILKAFFCGGHSAVSEEMASQPSAIEAPQVLDGDYEIISEEVIHVDKDGNAGRTPALDREVVKNAVKNYLAAYASRPTSRKQDFVVQVQLDGMPMGFDLEDPRAITGIEYILDSITKRIGDLAVTEDLMEEFRETAMRLQGILQPEEEYRKYNSLFATHDILEPKQPASKQEVAIRKMTLADIDPNVPRPGVILYGHGRCRDPVWRKDLRTPGWKRMVAVEKALASARRKHENSRRTKAKAAMLAQYERWLNPRNAKEVQAGRHYRKMMETEREISIIHEQVMRKVGPIQLKAKRLLNVKRREERIDRNERLFQMRRPKSPESRVIRGLMQKYSRLDRRAMSQEMKDKLLNRRITEKMRQQEIELREERKLLKALNKNRVILKQVMKDREREKHERDQRSLLRKLRRGVEKLRDVWNGKIPKPSSGMVVAPTISEEPEAVAMPPVVVKRVPYTPPPPAETQVVIKPRVEVEINSKGIRLRDKKTVYRALDSGLLVPEDYLPTQSVINMLDRMRVS